MHVEGFRTALTSVMNKYARGKNLLKEKDDNLTGEDIREGLTAIISVKLREPQFEGQTKAKLGNVPMRSFVQKATNERLSEWFDENPTEANKIVKKAIAAQQARVAAKKARETVRRKTALSGAGMPDKLVTVHHGAQMNQKSSSLRAIRLAVQQLTLETLEPRRFCRSEENPQCRALPNRQNAENNEIQALITAIGAGVGEDFNVEKARYHKVIALCDADVDGSHIRTLLLTFFFRQMRDLVEAGYIYIAQPPLYSTEVGKEKVYLKDDLAKDRFLRETKSPKRVPTLERSR